MRTLVNATPYLQGFWAGLFCIVMLPRAGNSAMDAALFVVVVGYFAISGIALARHLGRRRAA